MQSILDNVSRLVPCDVLELKLWNADAQVLVPYRFQNPMQVQACGDRHIISIWKFDTTMVARRVPIMLADARSQLTCHEWRVASHSIVFGNPSHGGR